MEIAFITSIVLLTLFALVAMFDGFYLHLIRYKLYRHAESKTEHLMHSLRALLFPLILTFLYLSASDTSFYIGLALVLLDIVVLGFDAYMEKDSRTFMGGLPRWEYILHLMVNGFHFASIAVFLVIKIRLQTNGVILVHDLTGLSQYHLFVDIVKQLIPGAVLMGLLHVALLFPEPVRYYDSLLSRFKCCSINHS